MMAPLPTPDPRWEAVKGLRIGARLDEEQIRLLLALVGPPGGGYAEEALRLRTQIELSVSLALLEQNKRALELAIAAGEL
jgi:hypothetical protein